MRPPTSTNCRMLCMVGRRLVAATSMSRRRCPKNTPSAKTRSAPACARVIAAKARSNASGPRAFHAVQLDAQPLGHLVHCLHEAGVGGIGRIPEDGHLGDGGEQVLEE